MKILRFEIRYFLFSLIILYNLSLGYYTFYGLNKSYNEYFCKQKRADNPDFVQDFRAKSLNLTNVVGEGKQTLLVSYGDGFYLYNRIYGDNDTTLNKGEIYRLWVNKNKLNGEFSLDYKVNTSYFKISCYSKYFESSLGGNNDKILYISDLDSYIINEEGYPRESPNSVGEFLLTGNKVKFPNTMICKVLKSPETCSYKQEYSDNFYLSYIIIISISSFILLLGFINFNGMFFLRQLSSIRNILNFKDKGFFCNPMTGEPIYLISGEEITKISDSEDPLYFTQDDIELDNLTDKDGSYKVVGSSVLVNCDTYKGKIDLGHKSRQLKVYFSRIFVQPKLCVVNEEENHYLSTIEVIFGLRDGMNLNLKEKRANGFVLDVKKAEYSILMKMFDIEDKLCRVVLEHNWSFFGSKYNLECIEKCMGRKTWSKDRPPGVKNTQWKRYTSDFKHIMEYFGFLTKCQVNLEPSKTLIDVINKSKIEGSLPILDEEVKINFEKFAKKPSLEGGYTSLINGFSTFGSLKDGVGVNFDELNGIIDVIPDDFKTEIIEPFKKIVELSKECCDSVNEIREVTSSEKPEEVFPPKRSKTRMLSGSKIRRKNESSGEGVENVSMEREKASTKKIEIIESKINKDKKVKELVHKFPRTLDKYMEDLCTETNIRYHKNVNEGISKYIIDADGFRRRVLRMGEKRRLQLSDSDKKRLEVSNSIIKASKFIFDSHSKLFHDVLRFSFLDSVYQSADDCFEEVVKVIDKELDKKRSESSVKIEKMMDNLSESLFKVQKNGRSKKKKRNAGANKNFKRGFKPGVCFSKLKEGEDKYVKIEGRSPPRKTGYKIKSCYKSGDFIECLRASNGEIKTPNNCRPRTVNSISNFISKNLNCTKDQLDGLRSYNLTKFKNMYMNKYSMIFYYSRRMLHETLDEYVKKPEVLDIFTIINQDDYKLIQFLD